MSSNKKRSPYTRISLYVFFTACAILVFYRFLDSIGDLFTGLKTIFSTATTIMMPFIIAIILAYVLRPICTGVEKLINNFNLPPKSKLTKYMQNIHRHSQFLSVSIVYVVLLVLIVIAVAYILPLVIKNLTDLAQLLPDYVAQINDYVTKWAIANPDKPVAGFGEWLLSTLQVVQTNFVNLLPNILSEMFLQLYGITSTFINLSISFVLAFYLLCDNGALFVFINKLMILGFGQKNTYKVTQVMTDLDTMFSRYLITRLLECLIVGIFCYIALVFFRTRFNPLLSTFYGISNIIPYIGPVIGLIPILLVTLFNNPSQTIMIIIVLTSIQCFEAWVIAPKLVGDRMGVNPFWVIFSMTVGSAIFGLWGLILATPIIAVVMNMIDRLIEGKAKELEKETKNKRAESLE